MKYQDLLFPEVAHIQGFPAYTILRVKFKSWINSLLWLSVGIYFDGKNSFRFKFFLIYLWSYNRVQSPFYLFPRHAFLYKFHKKNKIWHPHNAINKIVKGKKDDDLRRSFIINMSQRMTFLYSPRLGNQSSWPVTKLTALISKVWWPSGTPNLDRTIALTTDAGGYGSISARMRSEAPEMTLYKEAYWPQAVSQSLAVSQPWLTSHSQPWT